MHVSETISTITCKIDIGYVITFHFMLDFELSN